MLIIDGWGLTALGTRQRQDLFDFVDDCHRNRSLVLTSQLPSEKWHDYIGDPTIADAVLDRVLHGAHQIELKGESMRKQSKR